MLPLSVYSAGVKPAATTSIGFRWRRAGVTYEVSNGRVQGNRKFLGQTSQVFKTCEVYKEV
ncbi:hypothetical protein [Pedobacter sp. D749]|uniref:hypothetical protein n=1 Tax=Pedobacter sp. D749 TaxID=2856523 RepID=UPI001C55A76A|nr:hypothetical protein [Pedobacter sp. D749]QXU42039.1 hypothetical protein KYH19_00060 [Pedobacter sp. D749]